MTRSRLRRVAAEARSAVRRLLGQADPWKTFRDFERRIHPDTWAGQPAVLDWLRAAVPAGAPRPLLAPDSPDPVVRRFAERWAGLERDFRGRHAAGGCRVLLFRPNFGINPAGNSLFRNLGDGLEFCGVPVAYWDEGAPLADRLAAARPTVLLGIDHQWYGPDPAVGREAVAALRDYRRTGRLALGLSSNHFPTDPAALAAQFDQAAALGVDFFVSFQAEPVVRARYRPFAARGFRVLSLEFGANPLAFHPVPGVPRDLDYVYLASSNYEKVDRAAAFLGAVLRDHAGVLLGPGWPRAAAARLPDDQLRYLYARARVGINLHVPFQIREACELNERAYNLAACGVPQVVDAPPLLTDRFRPGSVYAAATPAEYAAQFRRALADPAEAAGRAADALDDVLAGHTVFHRADRLVGFLREGGHAG